MPVLFDFVSYKYQIRTFTIRMKMKLFTKAFSLLGITTLAVLFSCGGDGGSGAAPEKAQLAKLSKTWELGEFTFEGGDSDQIETNFSITFSGTFNSGQPEGPYNFTVEGTQTPSPFPADGTWTFAAVDGNSGQISLGEDNLAISYAILSNGELRLMFECETCNYDGARSSAVTSVNGVWEFTLEPKTN